MCVPEPYRCKTGPRPVGTDGPKRNAVTRPAAMGAAQSAARPRRTALQHRRAPAPRCKRRSSAGHPRPGARDPPIWSIEAPSPSGSPPSRWPTANDRSTVRQTPPIRKKAALLRVRECSADDGLPHLDIRYGIYDRTRSRHANRSNHGVGFVHTITATPPGGALRGWMTSVGMDYPP
jgi:hypothetical protein